MDENCQNITLPQTWHGQPFCVPVGVVSTFLWEFQKRGSCVTLAIIVDLGIIVDVRYSAARNSPLTYA